MTKSAINWLQGGYSWNVTSGCSPVSAGCDNCWAARQASTRLRDHPRYQGLTDSNGRWTGKVHLHADKLDEPLDRHAPTFYLLCSMSDLFDERVPDHFIDKVFAVMAECAGLKRGHLFMLLTKRAERMLSYLTCSPDGRYPASASYWWVQALMKMHPECPMEAAECVEDVVQEGYLPNLILGVSVENQATADERIDWLLRCPAACHAVSIEPCLGPVNLEWCVYRAGILHALTREITEGRHGLDWVILGGESGPHARPMHPKWAQQTRDQCAAAGVPFYFKQWGEYEGTLRPVDHYAEKHPQFYYRWPDGLLSARIGTKRAGRLLDGVEHNGMPAIYEQWRERWLNH